MDASSPLPTVEELASIPNGYFRLDLSGNPIYKKGNQLLPFGAASSNVDLGDRSYTASQSEPTNPNPGDYWDQIDENNLLVDEWFWNGVYWLSRQKFSHASNPTSISSTVTNLIAPFPVQPNTDLFVESWQAQARVGGATSASAYWRFKLKLSQLNAVYLDLPGTSFVESPKNLLADHFFSVSNPSIKSHVLVQNGSAAWSFAITAENIGGAAALNSFIYRTFFRYAKK
jgi:hypothetical protein